MKKKIMAYKYMTTDRFFKCFDRYLEGELYFADWHELNDPMEGFFSYSSLPENVRKIESLIREKNEYKVCCLSTENNNMLLWSHYADGHNGVCLELELEIELHEDKLSNSSIIAKPIVYETSKKYIQAFNKDSLIEILTNKLSHWNYENEFRLLSEIDKPKMQKIGTLKRVILGCRNKIEDALNQNTIKLAKETINHNREKIVIKDLH